jgi:type I restriction enzyme S subunit
LKYFSELCAPILQKLESNESESRKLVALRETLLPKLMSGDLRVPDAEQFIREA